VRPGAEQGQDQTLAADADRDPLANRAAVLAARQRPMSERLELALNWNTLASELRAGLAAARSTRRP
jgi:hypothetical protein